MSDDIRAQQRWLIAGVAILVLFLILIFGAIFRSVQNSHKPAQIGHRAPASHLGYCGPELENDKLCIVSFGQIVDGNMLVNFQLPRILYPDFHLIINRYGVESPYECRRVEALSTLVTCAGASQVPGEPLQFKVISKRENILLAEGKVTIIGIALSTPEMLMSETPTLEVTGTPTETPTLPSGPTPSPTRTPTPGTSYPNPSYP